MFEKIVLSNGLRIILTHIPQVRSLSIGVWIRAGVANEDGFPNGISHFLEHMLFKGTKTRTSRDIAREIEDLGGEINAFTSREYTCFYTRSLDEYAVKCLDILSDIYFNSKFDEAETEKEKNVICQEISMYEDTPDELVHDLVIRTMWQKSMYGFPISGTKDSVISITGNDIKTYINQCYTAGNTVISVAGNFNRDELLKCIENKFVFNNMNLIKDSQFFNGYTPGVCYIDKDTEQNHICIGFSTYNIFDQKNYDLACFNSIFGNGMSSVLFQRIREELGLVYSVYSYNSAFTRGGSLVIYAGLDKQNTDLFFKEIASLLKNSISEKISEHELTIVKNKLRSNYILALESPSSLMNYAGSSETIKGYINTTEEISDKIERITLESMYASVNDVFNCTRSIVLIGKYEDDLNNIIL